MSSDESSEEEVDAVLLKNIMMNVRGFGTESHREEEPGDENSLEKLEEENTQLSWNPSKVRVQSPSDLQEKSIAALPKSFAEDSVLDTTADCIASEQEERKERTHPTSCQPPEIVNGATKKLHSGEGSKNTNFSSSQFLHKQPPLPLEGDPELSQAEDSIDQPLPARFENSSGSDGGNGRTPNIMGAPHPKQNAGPVNRWLKWAGKHKKTLGKKKSMLVKGVGQSVGNSMMLGKSMLKDAKERVRARTKRGQQIADETQKPGNLEVDAAFAETQTGRYRNMVTVKARRKNYMELTQLSLQQSLKAHAGAVWCVVVNKSHTMVATGGQDSMIHVFTFTGSLMAEEPSNSAGAEKSPEPSRKQSSRYVQPLKTFSGHKADVTSLDWSGANFLLSSSVDKTVRLWHPRRSECLAVFLHTDLVTCVCFRSDDERYFLSGNFDRKIRLWSIPEHRVVEWVQASNHVTAVGSSPDGQVVAAGLHSGQCFLYQGDNLRYKTQLDCTNAKGKHKNGRKVTGVEFSASGAMLLVTTNDSRIRLCALDDYRLVAKYKGFSNSRLQIKASFSPNGEHIISGSEDGNNYLWRVQNDYVPPIRLPDALRAKDHKSSSFEYFQAASRVVTCSIMLPGKVLSLELNSPGHSPAKHQRSVNHDPERTLSLVEAKDKTGTPNEHAMTIEKDVNVRRKGASEIRVERESSKHNSNEKVVLGMVGDKESLAVRNSKAKIGAVIKRPQDLHGRVRHVILSATDDGIINLFVNRGKRRMC